MARERIGSGRCSLRIGSVGEFLVSSQFGGVATSAASPRGRTHIQHRACIVPATPFSADPNWAVEPSGDLLAHCALMVQRCRPEPSSCV